jgi:hypothetical protein
VKTFIRRWVLASAGFLALELATRPTPPRRDVLSDRAAALWIDLADLDRELRTTDPADLWRDLPSVNDYDPLSPDGVPLPPVRENFRRPAAVRVPPRSICLCDRCRKDRGARRV